MSDSSQIIESPNPQEVPQKQKPLMSTAHD